MLVLRAVLVLIAFSNVESAYRRVCYYTNWAQYRQTGGKFFPGNVDPNLCTHIIFSFAKLAGNKLHAVEWNDESTSWNKGMFEHLNDLKKRNPSLKTMIAVGGWNMGSQPFTRMVSSSSSRQEFATSTVKFLRDHKFDGLDLDWEYPANRGSPAGDKQKFGELLKVLRREFDNEAHISRKAKLLLSAATAAGKSNIDTAYDFPSMVRNLDMINLMTYDIHGSWESHTGHHSPLYKHSSDADNYHSIDFVASYYVKKGVPSSMINVGLGMYGRSFTLSNPVNNGLGAPARGAGTAGRFTKEKGFLAYYEICEILKTGGRKHMIADQMVPYVVKGSEWIGYDDPQSLQTKVQYVKQHHYGGVMVWALDLDDFSGSCGQGKYPLLHAINHALGTSTGPNVHPVITHAPIVTQRPHHTDRPTHSPVHTQPPHHTQAPSSGNGDKFCQGKTDGHYRDPRDCRKFYQCSFGLAFHEICGGGTVFNAKIFGCDFPSHVHGCEKALSNIFG